MICEEKLLSTLSYAIDNVSTEYVKIVDSSLWGSGEPGESELPSDPRIMWLEAETGVHIININSIRHFNKQLSSLEELFKDAVDAGYTVKSKTYNTPECSKAFEFTSLAKTHIALVTMFSPKAFKSSWSTFVEAMDVPEGVTVDIILGDNSGNEQVRGLHDTLNRKLAQKYQKIHIVDLGAPYFVKPEDHYLEMYKHAHIAVKYSKLLREPVKYYDYILKVEDDIEPPKDGLLSLYKSMKDLERRRGKVACVAGYYRQKIDPAIPCLSLRAELWGDTPRIEDLPAELFRVEMQGGGFSLYSTTALAEALPYKLTFKRPNGAYYMTGWDGTAGEVWCKLGWEQYCDGRLYCKHHF